MLIMRRFKFWSILFVLVAMAPATSFSQVTPPVWQDYLDAKVNETSSVLPDFSYAGYHKSEQPLPDVEAPEYAVFDITAYGAVANDGQSDLEAITTAIEAASNHSGKAMVYFPDGKFRIRELSDFGKAPIVIKKDNIVLKGNGVGKTELYADQPVFMHNGAMIRFTPDRPNVGYFRGDNKVTTILSYPVSGGYELVVGNAAALEVGMIVIIDADLNVNTQKGKDYFEPHEVLQGVKDRKGGDNDYLFEIHEIAAIDGNTVTFAEPIKLALNYMEDAVLFTITENIRESGIQDMTINGNYQGSFSHHSGSKFGESYRMLRFEDAINCWVKNIRMVDYSFAMQVYRGMYNTFTNMVLEGNPGHHAFSTDQGSYGNMFSYIRENTDSHHGFGGRGGATNTVHTRCNQFANLEAHGGWMRHTLFDKNEGDFFKNRSGGGPFFPFHGKGLTYWNWEATKNGSYDFWPEGARYGYIMPPIVVGLTGKDVNNVTNAELVELAGVEANPESLFEAQLAERLGSLPSWIQEESNLFETVSRYSSVKIVSPIDHNNIIPVDGKITIMAELHEKMNPAMVKSVELWASETSIYKDFQKVSEFTGWNETFEFMSGGNDGTMVFKIRMINTRDEVTDSKPVVVYLGDPQLMEERVVKRAGFMSKDDKDYGTFTSKGGGQGRMPSYDFNDVPWEFYQKAVAYHNEQQQLYLEHGATVVKPVIESAANIANANKAIDGDPSTTVDKTYHSSAATVLQFDLGEQQLVDRVDFHWKTSKLSDVKLEIQTSNDSNAWYSVVNDEPRWEFATARLGSTLTTITMPGNDSVSSVYIPKRRCRYVRLLPKRFGNNTLSEIKIFGRLDMERPNALVTELAGQGVQLTWKEDMPGESGFIIERKLSTEDVFTVIDSVDANLLTYNDISVSGGSIYDYRLRAYEGESLSLYSNESTIELFNFSLKYKNGDDNSLNDEIKPSIQLYNHFGGNIAYEALKARYWFTAEEYTSLESTIDWAGGDKNNVVVKFNKLSPARVGAHYYAEIGFKTGAGNLEQGGDSGPLAFIFTKNDQSIFNEEDDYSYNNISAFTETTSTTLYLNGELIWGTEPIEDAVQTSSIKVLSENISGGDTNVLGKKIKVANEGNKAIDLKNLIVRYWFTQDGDGEMSFTVDKSVIDKQHILGELKESDRAVYFDRGENYLEMSFDGEQDSIYALSNTGAIELEISKTGGGPFDESNDFSYNSVTGLSENANITAYYNGELIWGAEPLQYERVPVKFEAEDFLKKFGVEVEGTANVGEGPYLSRVDNLDWIFYEQVYSEAGTYEFRARVASSSSGGKIRLIFDNDQVGELVVDDALTDGDDDWYTAKTLITLGEGLHKIRTVFAGDGDNLMNVNWFELTDPSVTAITDSPEYIRVFPNPVGEVLHVFSADRKLQEINVMDNLGKIVLSKNIKREERGVDLDMSSLPNGIYFVSIVSVESIHVVKILKDI